MPDITVCKVLNKSNDEEREEFTVCTEWTDYDLNIIILRENKSSLQGKTELKSFEKYAKTFVKSLDTYLQEIKDILSGKKNEIEFHLREKEFFWKKKTWTLGHINVMPISDIECITKLTLELADNYSTLKRYVSELKENCMKFENLNSKLNETLDHIIVRKNEMEESLYKKFILLLNTKKNKIKELKSSLKNLEKNTEAMFNASTDDSDYETDSKKQNYSSPKKSIKRNNNYDEISNIYKRKKEENITEKSNNDMISNPSTSKSMNVKNLDEDEETPDMLSDESECEVELQLDDEKIETVTFNKNRTCAINNESSEEMF